MSTRYPRITLSIKLTHGRDDDLIAWWQSIPIGARHGRAKEALRHFMGTANAEAPMAIQLGHLHKELAQMRSVLKSLPAALGHLAVQATDVSPHQDGSSLVGLSAEGKARREQRIGRAVW